MKSNQFTKVDNEKNWDMDDLNKAYRLGYISGLGNHHPLSCPYDNEILASAWQAGYDDTQSLKANPNAKIKYVRNGEAEIETA